MKMRFFGLMAGLLLCLSCNSQSKVPVISPEDFAKAIAFDSTAVVLDVRQKAEFESGHLQGAILLNFLDKAEFDKGLQGLDKSKTYYLYCRSGRRSNQAANRMLKEGFKVFDMKGGIIEWQKAGLPIVK